MGARSGNNYLSSLKKLGAEIWIGGARAGDVTAHPAFANCARSVASLYDMQTGASRDHDVSHRRRRARGDVVHNPEKRRRPAQASADDEDLGGLRMRDARAHAGLPQRESRGDGGGARFLRRKRSALRRQHLELLRAGAPSRLVRHAYPGKPARQPRRRMGRTYRRRPRAQARRKDQRRHYRERLPDAGDAGAALARNCSCSPRPC